jgi:L-amino acid N-acyltransferase YncA
LPSTIRLATEYDAAQILAIYEYYVVNTPITFEVDPPSETDMRRRIIETLVHYPWLVCEDEDGGIRGYVYASRHRPRAAYQWCVDTAVYIDFRYHRQGIGKAMYTSLFNILPTLGLTNAYAGISLPNSNSVGLHESLGFTQIGLYKNTGYKDGKWWDVGWWELILADHNFDPPVPVPFSKVALSPEVDGLVKSGCRFLK